MRGERKPWLVACFPMIFPSTPVDFGCRFAFFSFIHTWARVRFVGFGRFYVIFVGIESRNATCQAWKFWQKHEVSITLIDSCDSLHQTSNDRIFFFRFSRGKIKLSPTYHWRWRKVCNFLCASANSGNVSFIYNHQSRGHIQANELVEEM